jgi:molecular chaperone HscB
VSVDAFDILGLPAKFDLTAAEIQRAYLARITSLHPDARGGIEDPEVARLNAAKQTLDDPESRASTLLTRLGGASKEQDRSLPDGFLMRMMAAREALDEAKAAGRTAEVDRFVDEAEREREGHIREVGRLFGAAAGGDRGALKAIRRELNAWRYIERLLEQVGPGGGAS